MTNVRFAVAVHVLTLLAHAQEPCTSAFIASSVNTHPVVVRRILGALPRAGLVTGQTGPGGGFRLAKAASKVKLSDVFLAVEDGAAPASHQPNPQCPVGRQVKGLVTDVGRRAEKAFLASLAGQTVEDLVRVVKKKAGSAASC
jgi:Rrf2 family protein